MFNRQIDTPQSRHFDVTHAIGLVDIIDPNELAHRKPPKPRPGGCCAWNGLATPDCAGDVAALDMPIIDRIVLIDHFVEHFRPCPVGDAELDLHSLRFIVLEKVNCHAPISLHTAALRR